MQMKRLKPPQTHCVVKRRSPAVLRRSKAEREAVLRGDKIKRSGAPNSLPGRLTCTRPGGCLPGFALRSLRLSPLFFLPTPPQIYSFIYLSAYRATSALRISSVPLGRVTRAPRCSKHTCVCVCVWRCCEDASSCCLVVPPHQPPTSRKREERG